ncbi:uncharacterized protein LOC134252601 [Saccostrea cucullata]|uniref:uncharacterized protein LOC134252601 n=1 Tax=Saccostrea cuccullata TaxID=36930 RepID=UPI002ED69389
MSESVFVGLCRIIGTSREVTMKREGGDLLDMVRRFQQLEKDVCGMTTGSYREGFRLKEHGPCSSFSSVELGIEMDQAMGFFCDFWPSSAFSFIERCHRPWPGLRVIDDIVKNGCHFVAIGSMVGHHEDKEWRISFSTGERKLVFSMNHCQFLTYGLLKLFLKEVINNGLSTHEQLLSSYHVKTVVLRVLQKDIFRDWCPKNLLEGFWICFKFILKCVYEGVCPNFFIPTNNMFLSKIYGEAQNNLFLRLHGLYEKGSIACLLHCSSISPYIIQVMINPSQHICTDEKSLTFESEIRMAPSHEIEVNDSLYSPDMFTCLKYLTILEQLSLKPLTQYQVSMLQKLVTTMLQRTAFILHNGYLCKELWPEQMYGIKNTELEHTFFLAIPNIVLLHMLEFLCYTNIDPVNAQTALQELQSLVHQDQEEPPSTMRGDVSWQVLGICQQIAGNKQAALYSFLKSIAQDSESKIQTVTLMRINSILQIINPERF